VPDLNLTFEPTFSASTEYFTGELELLEQDILQSFVYNLSIVPNEII
jgi:hypothetical protein